MAALALRRNNTNSVPMTAVATNSPPNHSQRSPPVVIVIGTMRVAKASAKQTHASTATIRTFQAGIRLSCGPERTSRAPALKGASTTKCTEDACMLPHLRFIHKHVGHSAVLRLGRSPLRDGAAGLRSDRASRAWPGCRGGEMGKK